MASYFSFELAAQPLHCPSCLVPSNWPAKYLRCEFYDQIKFSLCIQKKSNQGQHFYLYLLCKFAWKKHQTAKCKKISCKRGDFSQQHLTFPVYVFFIFKFIEELTEKCFKCSLNQFFIFMCFKSYYHYFKVAFYI